MALDYLVRLRDGVSGAANAAQGAVSRLRQSLRQLTQTANETGASFDRAAGRWRNASGQFVGGSERAILSAGKLKWAVLGIAAAAGAAGVALGKSVLEGAVFRESSITRLNALLGKGRGEAEFKDAIKIAEKTPFEPKQVVDALASLATTFRDDTQRRELFGAVSDFTATVGGGDAQVLKQVIKAVTDIAGKGQLEMEELKGQLADAGLGLDRTLPEIAKLLGIRGSTEEQTADKVRKAIQDGKVSGQVGVYAVYEAMKAMAGGGPAGSATEAASDSLAGLISNIKGGMQTVLAMANTEDWAGIKALRALLKDVAGLFSSDSDAGQSFQKVLRRLADTTAPMFTMMRSDLRSVGSLLNGTGAESQRFYEGMSQILVTLYGVGRAAVWLGGAFAEGFGYVARFAEWIGETLAKVYLFGEDMQRAGGELVDGLVRGIQEAAGRLRDSVLSLGRNAVAWMREALQSRSPSRLFMAIGRDTAEGYALGVSAGGPEVRGNVRELAANAVRGAAVGREGGGAGPISVSVVLQLGSAGADPKAVAQELLPQIGAATRDAVDQALSRMVQEV